MAYALIQSGQVVAYPYTITQFQSANPTISLPATPTEAQLNEVSMYTVYPTPKPSYNPITQNCAEGTPVSKDGLWYKTWVVSAASSEEIAVREEEARAANKQEASRLLYETDWTTIPDVANKDISSPYLVNVQDFIAYRNQVRAVAINPPAEIVIWPNAPQAQWA